jgi:hypothetical protein
MIWTSAKGTLGLLWEGKITKRFFLPNFVLVDRAQGKPILPGNRETDFREGPPNAILSRLGTQEYRPKVHFAEVQL